MGNHSGKRELGTHRPHKDRTEHGERGARAALPQDPSEDSDVFGAADVAGDNGGPSQDRPVTDSRGPKNAWQHAGPAEPGGRPHLTRLFSRDAPGREDNTFKERPSESDELQTIEELGPDMAAQKRPSQRHGTKYLASASPLDHGRPGFLPRRPAGDQGLLQALGRFFSGDRAGPKRGSGKVPWLKQHGRRPPSQPSLCSLYKDTHHATRPAHYGSLPQKSSRAQDENPVVHFFKNIVTPRTPPPSQGKGRGLSLSRFSWGAEGQKPGFGYGARASAHKGLKADAQGTLSKIFKLLKRVGRGQSSVERVTVTIQMQVTVPGDGVQGGRDSRTGSPLARR